MPSGSGWRGRRATRDDLRARDDRRELLDARPRSESSATSGASRADSAASSAASAVQTPSSSAPKRTACLTAWKPSSTTSPGSRRARADLVQPHGERSSKRSRVRRRGLRSSWAQASRPYLLAATPSTLPSRRAPAGEQCRGPRRSGEGGLSEPSRQPTAAEATSPSASVRPRRSPAARAWWSVRSALAMTAGPGRAGVAQRASSPRVSCRGSPHTSVASSRARRSAAAARSSAARAACHRRARRRRRHRSRARRRLAQPARPRPRAPRSPRRRLGAARPRGARLGVGRAASAARRPAGLVRVGDRGLRPGRMRHARGPPRPR